MNVELESGSFKWCRCGEVSAIIWLGFHHSFLVPKVTASDLLVLSNQQSKTKTQFQFSLKKERDKSSASSHSGSYWGAFISFTWKLIEKMNSFSKQFLSTPNSSAPGWKCSCQCPYKLTITCPISPQKKRVWCTRSVLLSFPTDFESLHRL